MKFVTKQHYGFNEEKGKIWSDFVGGVRNGSPFRLRPPRWSLSFRNHQGSTSAYIEDK